MLCCDRKIMKRVDSTVTVEGGGLSKSKLGVCRLELAVRVHDEVVDMLHCLLACKITFANIRHAGNSNKYGNTSCGISNKNNAKKLSKKCQKHHKSTSQILLQLRVQQGQRRQILDVLFAPTRW